MIDAQRNPQDMIEKMTVSSIGPSWCRLLPDVERWASEVAALVRNDLSGKVSASIWPYRDAGDRGAEMLTVDLAGSEGGDFNLTFGTGCTDITNYGFSDLRQTCIQVPDLTEAMGMAFLLLDKLSATVSLTSRS